MSTHRIAVTASLAVVLAIAGCAHEAPAPSSAAPQAGEAAAATPALDPTTPEGIVALGQRLTAHRRSLFSVTRGKYTYFAGGVLSADYEVATKILRISSLEPGKDFTCEYSPQGKLFVDPGAHPDQDAFEAGCNQLALRLNDELSR